VCGGRHDPNREQLHRELGHLASAHRGRRIVVVSGGATGADVHACTWDSPTSDPPSNSVPPIGRGTLWPQCWAST
jgi:hypothetical protein